MCFKNKSHWSRTFLYTFIHAQHPNQIMSIVFTIDAQKQTIDDDDTVAYAMWIIFCLSVIYLNLLQFTPESFSFISYWNFMMSNLHRFSPVCMVNLKVVQCIKSNVGHIFHEFACFSTFKISNLVVDIHFFSTICSCSHCQNHVKPQFNTPNSRNVYVLS